MDLRDIFIPRNTVYISKKPCDMKSTAIIGRKVFRISSILTYWLNEVRERVHLNREKWQRKVH